MLLLVDAYRCLGLGYRTSASSCALSITGLVRWREGRGFRTGRALDCLELGYALGSLSSSHELSRCLSHWPALRTCVLAEKSTKFPAQNMWEACAHGAASLEEASCHSASYCHPRGDGPLSLSVSGPRPAEVGQESWAGEAPAGVCFRFVCDSVTHMALQTLRPGCHGGLLDCPGVANNAGQTDWSRTAQWSRCPSHSSSCPMIYGKVGMISWARCRTAEHCGPCGSTFCHPRDTLISLFSGNSKGKGMDFKESSSVPQHV